MGGFDSGGKAGGKSDAPVRDSAAPQQHTKTRSGPAGAERQAAARQINRSLKAWRAPAENESETQEQTKPAEHEEEQTADTERVVDGEIDAAADAGAHPKRVERKVFRAKSPSKAPGAPAPGTRKLQTECQSDPVAKQKYADVLAESAPGAAAKKAAFLKAAEEALNASPTTKPIDAMRSVVRGGGYFFLGPQIPDAEVIKGGGVSRVLDLPGLYKYGYVKPTVQSKFPNEDAFVDGAAKGKFDPNSDIDERKSMRGAGGVNETWWFPSGEANAVDLTALLDALYIKDNPNYSKGAVRFDLDPASLAALDIKLYKPTAFDGMMQGWGNDPWWVTKPGPWGITKNNTHEAVMQSQQFRFYKQRSLIMPAKKATP